MHVVETTQWDLGQYQANYYMKFPDRCRLDGWQWAAGGGCIPLVGTKGISNVVWHCPPLQANWISWALRGHCKGLWKRCVIVTGVIVIYSTCNTIVSVRESTSQHVAFVQASPQMTYMIVYTCPNEKVGPGNVLRLYPLCCIIMQGSCLSRMTQRFHASPQREQ